MKADMKETDTPTLLIEAPREDSIDDPLARQAREDQIRIRSYEIYLERDHERDKELDDWLQAEREFEDLASESRLLS